LAEQGFCSGAQKAAPAEKQRYLMGKAYLAFTGTVEELDAQPEIREKYLEV